MRANHINIGERYLYLAQEILRQNLMEEKNPYLKPDVTNIRYIAMVLATADNLRELEYFKNEDRAALFRDVKPIIQNLSFF